MELLKPTKIIAAMGLLARAIQCISLLLLLGGSFAPGAKGQDKTIEYNLKAAYVFNFAQFVTWPAETFPTSQSPIVIGFVGASSVADHFEEALRGKTIGDRPFRIRRFSQTPRMGEYHILYVPQSERRRPLEYLPESERNHILTVGETQGFADQGGVINLVGLESKIQFEINLAAAERSGLKISARLLKLAQRVIQPTN